MIMEMLEILKGRLPEGLEIVKTKNKGSQTEIKFSYEGLEVVSWLPKTCTPGAAEYMCDSTLYGAMANVYMKRGDFDTAKFWMDKQLGLVRS